ncbi:MAG: HAMP domain-containing protein [Ignavibacteriaceae bacterium]|nr:HAMP domain-containing protein [Ignavibacteriaceae bacterium]
MKLSWRHKLIIFAVLIALLPLAISSYNMIDTASSELKSSTNSELMNTSSRLSDQINNIYTLQWISPLYFLRSGIENPNLGVEEKLALVQAAVENIPDLLFIDLVFETAPNEYTSAFSISKEYFTKKAEAKKISIDSLFRVNNSFIVSLKQQKKINIVYLDPQPSALEVDSLWMMSIGMQINIPGAPPAMFIAKFSAAQIEKLLRDDTFSQSGELFILNKKGNSLFTRSKSSVHENVKRDVMLMLEKGSSMKITNSYDLGGDEDIVTSVAIPVNLEWAVVAQKKVSIAYAAVIKMSNDLLIYVAIGLVFAFIAVFGFSSTISKPIVNISKTAVTIAKGNFDIDVDYKIDDEIGRLGKSLVDMSSSLKASFAKIEKQNKELEEYSRTLEIKVDERTKELKEKNTELEATLVKLKETQDQLIVQQKLASLGALTAGIAHEIKNPLNFVNNFAKLTGSLVEELQEEMERGKEGDMDFGYLEEILGDIKTNATKIAEHGSRADNIVKSMLEHSRTEKGEMQKFDLNGLVTETMGLAYHGMRSQIESFNTKLEKTFKSESLQITGTPQALNQVFINIFNNAFYAMHKKREQQGEKYSPCLTATTKDIGEKVEVRIRDNGTGIPKEVVEKIFEPFFTTKPTGEGTGLGLSLTYDIIVQMHKGELKVVTEPGEFSEFIIVLPKNQ